MSHDAHTLRQRLRQQLQAFQESGSGTDWLRELVEWLAQVLLYLEFSEFLEAEPYERNGARRARKEVHRQSRDLFNAPDQAQAQVRANRLIIQWQARFPELAVIC